MSTLTGEEVRQTSTTGAQKGQKIQRVDLLPVIPILKVAEHYGVGARKYAERNWEAGYQWSLSYQSMMRHALQFWAGEDFDDETGTPHLAAVVFHALALMEFMETHPEFDNRPTTLAATKAAAATVPEVPPMVAEAIAAGEDFTIAPSLYKPVEVHPRTWATLEDVPGDVEYVQDDEGDYWRRNDDGVWTVNTDSFPQQPAFWQPWSWKVPKRSAVAIDKLIEIQFGEEYQVAMQLARTEANRVRP